MNTEMLTDVKKILVFKAAEAEKKGRQTAGEKVD